MEGVYINLDKRTDRREHFEKNIQKYPFFSNITRMSAIEHQDGSIGQALSHIKALESLSTIQTPYVAVLEDDFMIFDEIRLSAFFQDFEKIKHSNKWKVISLTPCGITVIEKNEMTQNGFKRIRANETTTGYIMKKEMIPILLENFNESVILQFKQVDKHISSIDQYWKPLQVKHPFYYYLNVFGGQLPGFSNISNCLTDYNDRFKKQPEY
jgi:GR25 family glycosyltransferase involved in LPS biosynthesis